MILYGVQIRSYKMITRTVPNGPLIRVVYKAVDSLETRWQKVADSTALIYPIIAKTFGAYPYKTYTFIQGGDGGMEYPMATLIKSASHGYGYCTNGCIPGTRC
jgi:hypothetical protein